MFFKVYIQPAWGRGMTGKGIDVAFIVADVDEGNPGIFSLFLFLFLSLSLSHSPQHIRHITFCIRILFIKWKSYKIN
jgi:hypothetical protein